MNILFLLFSGFVLSCSNKSERIFTGSTPAGKEVRIFLGIPSSDSVDFIRWKLIIHDNEYEINCQYGIGKPNTKGFINGGERLIVKDEYRKEGNIYYFTNGKKVLRFMALNPDLLHPLDKNNHMLVGTGGWSYTLSNIMPVHATYLFAFTPALFFHDSLDIVGRTPCDIPGIVRNSEECFKLKWHIIIYKQAGSEAVGKYKISGTAWRNFGVINGSWKIIRGKRNESIFEFYNDKGNVFMRLLWIDTGVLVFADSSGNLLVGNEDFSYTLNRKN